MSPSPPFAPHVQLQLEEAQVLLDHAKVTSGNQWSQVLIALDRLNELIGEIREQLTPPEPDDTVARIKLYRSNTGSGWTAAWFVDVDEPRQAGGLVGHHETWRSAYGAALARLEDHLDVT